MWRIYSPDLLGVRITTTVGLLRQAIENFWVQDSALNTQDAKQMVENEQMCFIRRVEYKKQKDFERMFKTTAIRERPEDFTEAYKVAMLTKRTAFAHEKEIRAIILPHITEKDASVAETPFPWINKKMDEYRAGDTKPCSLISGDTLRLPICPPKFFRKIMFDPRLHQDIANACGEKIRQILPESPETVISRSTMYEKPNGH